VLIVSRCNQAVASFEEPSFTVPVSVPCPVAYAFPVSDFSENEKCPSPAQTVSRQVREGGLISTSVVDHLLFLPILKKGRFLQPVLW
jgi:hypothetical protein